VVDRGPTPRGVRASPVRRGDPAFHDPPSARLHSRINPWHGPSSRQEVRGRGARRQGAAAFRSSRSPSPPAAWDQSFPEREVGPGPLVDGVDFKPGGGPGSVVPWAGYFVPCPAFGLDPVSTVPGGSTTGCPGVGYFRGAVEIGFHARKPSGTEPRRQSGVSPTPEKPAQIPGCSRGRSWAPGAPQALVRGGRVRVAVPVPRSPAQCAQQRTPAPSPTPDPQAHGLAPATAQKLGRYANSVQDARTRHSISVIVSRQVAQMVQSAHSATRPRVRLGTLPLRRPEKERRQPR
jgi:hypothetical protein